MPDNKKIVRKGYTASQFREIESEFQGKGIQVKEVGNGKMSLSIPVKDNVDYIKNFATAYDKFVSVDDRFVDELEKYSNLFTTKKETAASFFPSSSVTEGSPQSSSQKMFESVLPRYNIGLNEDPFNFTANSFSDGREMIKVALALTKRDYMCRQVVESMAQFSNSGLIFSGKQKYVDFYEQWIRAVKMRKVLGKIFKGYYGHGNVTIFKFSTPILQKSVRIDKANILKLYKEYSILDLLSFENNDHEAVIDKYRTKKEFAAKKEIWSKTKLPVLYLLLNPLRVENVSPSLFGLGESYYNLEDKVIKSIKHEIKYNIKTNNSPIGNSYNKYPVSFLRKVNELKKMENARILLDPEFAIQLFREKEDWENYAVPMIWTSVPLLKYKNRLRTMDNKLIDSMINKILKVTIGSKDNPATAKQMKYLAKILTGDNNVMTLLWNYTLEAEFVEPDMKALDMEKYAPVNKDIKESFGVPGALFGGEGTSNFSNSFMEIKTFSEKLHTGREDVSDDFIIPEMESVADAMGFDTIPQCDFEPIKLRDENKLFDQLYKKLSVGALSVRKFSELTGSNWAQELPLIKIESKLREEGVLPAIGVPGSKTKDGTPRPEGGRPESISKEQPDNIEPENNKKEVKPKEK